MRSQFAFLVVLSLVALVAAGCDSERLLYGFEPTKRCLEDHDLRVNDTSDGSLTVLSDYTGVRLHFYPTETEAAGEARLLNAVGENTYLTRNVNYEFSFQALTAKFDHLLTDCLTESLVPRQAVMVGVPPLRKSISARLARSVPLLASTPGWEVVAESSGAGLITMNVGDRLERYRMLAVRVVSSRRQPFEAQTFTRCFYGERIEVDSGDEAVAEFAGRTPAAFQVPTTVPMDHGCLHAVRIVVRLEGTASARVVLAGR